MKLSAQTARERFAAARVARLATVSGTGEPHLVPFTFVVDGDRIGHAVDQKPKSSRQLRRLANIAADGRACALVDEYAEDWRQLWWVRADGTARVAEDPGDLPALLAAKYRQYQANPPLGPYIIIDVTQWTGWSAT